MPGMYNWCFFYDFEFSSTWFNDYKKLMHDLCVTRKSHMEFFHLVARPVLHLTLHLILLLKLCLTLHPTLKSWGSWRLLYLWLVLGKSTTWYFFTVMTSNYWALEILDWDVMLSVEWFVWFLEATCCYNTFNVICCF